MDRVRWAVLIIGAAGLAACSASKPAGYNAPYSIASQITSATAAPAVTSLMSWVGGPLWGSKPPDVDPAKGSPPLLCVSGANYDVDRPNCGDQSNASTPYGIFDVDGVPEIGIGIAVPADNPLNGGIAAVYIQSGDASCDAFANNGRQGQPPTRWWQYKIPNPGGSAMTFTATVGFVANSNGQSYAQLTSCSLAPPSSPPDKTPDKT